MSKQRNFRRQMLFFFLFSVVEYLFFHIAYLLTDAINGYALFPIRLSLSVFPVTAAVALVRDSLDFKSATLRALIISLTRFLSSFLYSYMFLIFGTSVRTAEALGISPILSIGATLVYFILILIAYGFIRLAFSIKKISYGTVSGYFPFSVTDFNNPVSLGAILFPLLVFAFELVFEIIGTVSFFIDYGISFRIDELVFIVLSYLFILLKLVISALLPSLLANKILADKPKQSTSNE